MEQIDGTNPFAGYEEKFKKNNEKKLNPVHEIVNLYYQVRGWESMPSHFYRGRHNYGKLASEAKRLLTECNDNLEDALWSIDKMNYKAKHGKFDWSIITCLKHDLRK